MNYPLDAESKAQSTLRRALRRQNDIKFSFVHAEHTCVDYDSPDIMLNRLAKSSVVSDIGADRAALFSLNLRGRARGRKQFGRSPIYQRSMLNGEIYTSTDLA